MKNILILGRAKTGTTIISQTIAKSIQNSKFLMEPKDISYFLSDPQFPLVTKIIFEHWQNTPHLRMALLLNELPLKFEKIVAIMRDPRDELLSRMFYVVYDSVKSGKLDLEDLKDWIALVKKKENDPNSVSVSVLLKELSNAIGWVFDFNMKASFQYFNYIRKMDHVHILRYEDFIDKNLTSLETYLGFKLAENVGVGDSLARTCRTASYGNWKYYFLQEDIEFFRKAYGPQMRRSGYNDWKLKPINYIDPNHGSIYIEKLIDEATTKRVR